MINFPNSFFLSSSFRSWKDIFNDSSLLFLPKFDESDVYKFSTIRDIHYYYSLIAKNLRFNGN